MQQSKRILVTGGTGKQGGAVARHLLSSGFTVRALTRSLDSLQARRLQEQGAELVLGNLEDPGSLERATTGVDGVFSVQNYWEHHVGCEGEIRQAKFLADAAKQAGVAHYVQSTMADAVSFHGVEHFESKAVVEHYIDLIGLPRTFIGTVYFMDNLLDPKMGGTMTFPVLSGTLNPQTLFHMIAVDDIGAIAAAVFRNPDRFIGEKLNVAGDVLTVGEMKEVYHHVMGKRPRAYWIPAWMLQLMNKEFAQQLHWHNRVGWAFTRERALQVHGGLMNFEQFLRTYQPQGL